MCGIFGIIHTERVKKSTFCQLAELNRVRGDLAFGYLTSRIDKVGGKTAVFRYPHPFNPDFVLFDDIQMALGHIRAPTSGQSNNVEDVHPLETVDAWLSHNGILLNYGQYPQWQLSTKSQVDSQFILGGVQTHLIAGLPPAQAIQNTIEKLDGQQACWLWHKTTQALYLWRVMSPIYVRQTPKSLIFSSVKPSVDSTLLNEGIIYRLQPRTMVLEQTETFAFYSPYRTI